MLLVSRYKNVKKLYIFLGHSRFKLQFFFFLYIALYLTLVSCICSIFSLSCVLQELTTSPWQMLPISRYFSIFNTYVNWTKTEPKRYVLYVQKTRKPSYVNGNTFQLCAENTLLILLSFCIHIGRAICIGQVQETFACPCWKTARIGTDRWWWWSEILFYIS